MLKPIVLGGLLACTLPAAAQSCEGGLYLNPQVIRGEGTPQATGAANELADFLRPSGLSVSPVVSIASVEEVGAALKRRVPPCWVYGNPVVGLASGYRAAAVNTEAIRAAVLVIGDVGATKDPKPVDLASLPPADQAKILARLKTASCMGIRSGVTTSLVKAEKLCGSVVDVAPQQGLGQSYLPTKAAFAWQPDRWVGLITRVQGAQAASMKAQIGGDARVHNAQLIVVPSTHPSWGYGLYVRPELPADVVRRAVSQLTGLRSNAHPLLLKALDVGAKFEFATPSSEEVDAMRKVLDTNS